tara:strand:- start:154 stop:483 length:330 start_codon:yes stop_codon:yes gene_type:complete
MKPLKVICIDASNKPEEIPEDLWVKQDEIYTIKDVARLAIQGDKIGYKFEEIELDESCFPYEFYNADRFMFLLDVTIAAVLEDLRDYDPDDNGDDEDDTPAVANFESLN